MLVFYLCREAAELEAWISEKETVAASEDIGRDLEHVEVSVCACILLRTFVILYFIQNCFCKRIVRK